MGLLRVSIPAPSSVHQSVHKESSFYWFRGVYWCKCVMPLIYYTVLTFIEEKPNLKQSLQSYSYAVAYPGFFSGGVQQIQLRTERTGIWGW